MDNITIPTLVGLRDNPIADPEDDNGPMRLETRIVCAAESLALVEVVARRVVGGSRIDGAFSISKSILVDISKYYRTRGQPDVR